MWRRPHGLRALTRWRKATSGSLSSRRSLSVSSEKASGVTSPSRNACAYAPDQAAQPGHDSKPFLRASVLSPADAEARFHASPAAKGPSVKGMQPYLPEPGKMVADCIGPLGESADALNFRLGSRAALPVGYLCYHRSGVESRHSPQLCAAEFRTRFLQPQSAWRHRIRVGHPGVATGGEFS
jgi:hypothetical protein